MNSSSMICSSLHLTIPSIRNNIDLSIVPGIPLSVMRYGVLAQLVVIRGLFMGEHEVGKLYRPCVQ
jgi:hypothetical protein